MAFHISLITRIQNRSEVVAAREKTRDVLREVEKELRKTREGNVLVLVLVFTWLNNCSTLSL